MMNYLLVIFSFVLLHVIGGEYIPPGPKYTCPKNDKVLYPCNCTRGTDEGLFVTCENTNLASLSISLQNLAALESPVEVLLIRKCSFRHLYGTLFYKARVRILKIEDTPLEYIDEGSFFGINETLQELYIENTFLKEFPKEALNPLGLLTILKIDGSRIESLDTDIFANSSAVGVIERLTLSNGQLKELQPQSFQTMRKLKFLDLHGNNLTSLKKSQFKNLRDVEVLDLSHNQIAKLDASHISDLTKLGWCNVSHNVLKELTRGTFARNSVLKVLNMAHNKITRLDANSFRGMRFLRRLYLNDNSISDIGRAVFASVARIGTIDLARNNIKKIDFQMFSELNYAEIIDVSGNNITEILKGSFKDLYLTNINISHNYVAKIEANAFINCANITVLDMSHNEITHFPGDAFDTTTYATVFQLSYNQLTDLSKVPLKNMTGLKVLNVSHNAIETIPKNTFPKLYELHTIDASFNNISDIFNGVFQTLFSLRFLNLSHNSLETLKSSTFGPLSTLLEMDLSDNILSNIARSAFTKLSSLQLLNLENNNLEKLFQIPISCSQLNLRRNQLTEIPERTWPTMNALLLLDLSHNRLENNLNGGSFNGLLTLQTLILSSNGITEVPWESFVPLSTLQYLHLENNNLTKLAKGAFGKLPVVFELNLFNNQISDISKKAFDGLLALLTLNLSTNSLETIPNDAFASLVALRTLDLSHNKLEKLDNKTNSIIEDCLSLIEIDLSFNRISFVTKKTFPSDPYVPYRLAKINLSHNKLPLITKDITFGTKKVTHLNISHNAISSFLPGALGNLTSLEVLDVSYNKIWDLSEANVFTLPENLTELYVSANNLAEIPMKEIVNASHLKILDVKFNKLTSLDQKLLNKIMIEGLQVNLEGNNFQCDCRMRPFKHYFESFTRIPDNYKNFICSSPMHIENQPLADVTDVQLNCPEDPFSEDYSALPDLQFREISFFRGNLLVRWFVTAQRDIADFYVLIRDEANAILFERHTSYDTRMVTIAKEEIFGTNGPQKAVQICVMAKLSTGNIERWFESQCKNLPENFSHETSHYKTVLFSTEPHSRRRLLLTSAISSSSRIHGKIIPKYSIILALISLCFI